jgi:hypothetical protein
VSSLQIWSGLDLQVHHLIEERFATTLSMVKSQIPSVVLTVEEHGVFTSSWRRLIGYSLDSSTLTTLSTTPQQILAAAQEIYGKYPELIKAVEDAFLQ